MERLTLFNLRQRSRITEPQTQTIIDQLETEQLVRKAYYEKLGTWKDDALRLFRLAHINYLSRKLVSLPTSFEHLDASQPWLAYWIVHSLRLLNFNLSPETVKYLIQFLKSTQHPDGGFGGGPHQFAHLATTYGAINCLASLCRRDALDIINRPALVSWLKTLHQDDGSFLMHIGGEADVRGAYCAVAVAKLTGILHSHPDVFSSTADWLAKCQTYEGGFGAQPGIEAHGGYTFCAVAALCLLGHPELIDLPRLLKWVAHRQMSSEGGFQGRTNKLVDSCYSFWQGATFPIIEDLLFVTGDPALLDDKALFNVSALQEYILLCCQKVSYTRPGLSVPTHDSDGRDPLSVSSNVVRIEGEGGLIDKPGKNADCYHTCYALSGLSVAQHSPRPRFASVDNKCLHMSIGVPNAAAPVSILCDEFGNELADLDPLHNILMDGLAFTTVYYTELDAGGKCFEEAEVIALKAAETCIPVAFPRTTTSETSRSHENQNFPEPENFKSTCTTP
ncbi:unnamed protein product [Dicrocoelium dendriticum]|nr:unnamed protein product [Dicrocoelium dendriticum]